MLGNDALVVFLSFYTCGVNYSWEAIVKALMYTMHWGLVNISFIIYFPHKILRGKCFLENDYIEAE